jgi:methylene-tetrahydromethanopterin dehydrogenase
MSNPNILHFLTPLPNASPFDVNMAMDAGFRVAIYSGIALSDITALTQDAMFSRAPSDAAKTCLFIGGRDAAVALDMVKSAVDAMLQPFVISVFADPSGAFTTAAAMVALVTKNLRANGDSLKGKRVAVFGAKGIVGGLVGVIAAQEGAHVTLVGHDGVQSVEAKAEEFATRFNIELDIADGKSDEAKEAVLADAEIVMAAARAGVQVLTLKQLQAAPKLLIAADINAVPPLGLEGVDLFDDGKPLPGSKALGIGALAIGDIKFKCQHGLLRQLKASPEPLHLDFTHAYTHALELVAP